MVYCEEQRTLLHVDILCKFKCIIITLLKITNSIFNLMFCFCFPCMSVFKIYIYLFFHFPIKNIENKSEKILDNDSLSIKKECSEMNITYTRLYFVAIMFDDIYKSAIAATMFVLFLKIQN